MVSYNIWYHAAVIWYTGTPAAISQFSPFLSGITRLPVLEGEVSHVEIPRTSPSLGITIVGGADTPLVSCLSLY